MSWSNNINLPLNIQEAWVLNFHGQHRVYQSKSKALNVYKNHVKKWSRDPKLELYKIKIQWEKEDIDNA